jgi:hypothetical protein
MYRYCYCGRCSLDTQNADFVVNGKPLCDPDCITRAREQQRELRRHRVGGQQIGRAARDIAPGHSWAFREHRSLADIPA